VASIHAIASLHALLTLQILDFGLQNAAHSEICNHLGFTSLLLALQKVPDVFDEAFRPYRFRVSRSADCLICRPRPTPSSSEDLDVALDQALARLGDG
jgi:hypothetical protein